MADCKACKGTGKVTHEDGGDKAAVPAYVKIDRGIKKPSVCADCDGRGKK